MPLSENRRLTRLAVGISLMGYSQAAAENNDDAEFFGVVLEAARQGAGLGSSVTRPCQGAAT